MKFSERWLREWVDPPIGTDELVAQLTGAGLEVDSAEPVAGALPDVLVGEVLAVSAHPEADRLHLCEVSVGSGEAMQVVCGAPNVHPGMRAPMALPGAKLPDGTKIRRSRIRGVESNGMLCSARELGLGEDAGGILPLDPDAPVGTPLAEHLGLDDVSIDIELTPNRGDCLGLAGIAREVAVHNRLEVAGPALAPVLSAVEDEFAVHLDAPEGCPRYVGRVIRDIDPTARTPLWMTERLRRSGLRPISPVVDVTNYVMLELGQPMHAFDLDTLEGAIRVRRAREGERLTLLDGAEVSLVESSLLIADEGRAVALAGVMGGFETSVTHATRNIFLESAYFEPKTISLEARRLGLHTDASHRFERGVSPEGQRVAAERATELLLDIVGGRPGPVTDAVEKSAMPQRPVVRLRAERVRRLLGVELAPETVSDILSRLGMEVRGAQSPWEVVPPAFRSDIRIEADLIEELARIHGYERIPAHAPRAELTMAALPEARVPVAGVRGVLVQRGYHEAVTYSFVEPGLQERLDPESGAVPLANPISSDMAVMRTSLWPGLVQAVLHNLHRQRRRVRLFETGRRFRRDGEAVRQEDVVAGAVTGPACPEQWSLETADADFYDVKGDVEALLALPGEAGAFAFRPAEHPGLHPGQTARIERDGHAVGYLGAVHPGLAREWKLAAPMFLFELDLDPIQAGHLPRFEALSRFPAVRRDIAVIFDDSVSAQAVRDCVGQAGIHVLEKLELFDVYRGEGIDSGKKSLALGLTFQAPSRTLKDAEVDRLVGRIVETLEKELGGSWRG